MMLNCCLARSNFKLARGKHDSNACWVVDGAIGLLTHWSAMDKERRKEFLKLLLRLAQAAHAHLTTNG